MVGRWLLAHPKLYIFDEPTIGVDVATKLELYRLLRKLADEGAAVLVLASDLLELIGLSDRILVVAHGTIVDLSTGFRRDRGTCRWERRHRSQAKRRE